MAERDGSTEWQCVPEAFATLTLGSASKKFIRLEDNAIVCRENKIIFEKYGVLSYNTLPD